MDEGKISVTPLHIDLTHAPSLHDLKRVLGGAPPKSVVA
jgi:5'-nucleotidase